VYKVNPAGNETVLYAFDGVGPNEDPNSYGPLVRDEAGNLYGTTSGLTQISYGLSVLFKVDPAGNETILHTFTGVADDVGGISFGLIRDEAGNFYGTDYEGGLCIPGCGVVFKVDPAGNETVLYSFTGGADGSYPLGLVRDRAGNLYGTTYAGGNLTASECVGFGCGVVFKLDPAGNETVLYAFTGAADGGYPGAGVVLDERGNLYGTTENGGDFGPSLCANNYGCGVVFKLTRSAAGGQQ